MLMAKKAKRRGRPPGSKNKKKLGRPAGAKGLTKSFANMEVGQLRAYINNLEDLLTKKVTQQRQILEGQLAGLQIYASNKAAAAAVRTVMRVPRTGKRRKPMPKYQSKKDKKLKWTGRGLLPVWMRAEMKGTKLTKEDFAIK
jgi:DNA-binding protein H-NS